MSQQSGPVPAVRDQALTLIDYLVAFEALRNPPVRRVADHRLFRLPADGLPQHPAVRVHPDDDHWLTVDFIDLPAAPAIPSAVSDLLTDPVLSASTEPALVAAPPGSTDEDLASWTTRVAPARDWIERVWRPWSTEVRTAESVKSLHRNLFEQREVVAVDRETYEIVWGFGRLRWTDRTVEPPETVDHPLLTVPVEIDMDRRSEQIVVRPAGGVEVETRMLNGLDLRDGAGYAAVRQQVSDIDLDPWAGDEVTDVYRRLVRAVHDHGIVIDATTPAAGPSDEPTAEPAGGIDRAVVEPTWTLFLRRRLPDSEGFLRQMRDLYRELPDVIPPPLRDILSVEPSVNGDGVIDPSVDVAGAAAEGLLLLPLAANEQQERILRTAGRQAGVVVQGPPGTGKSHTIANLVSHFVAEGKRVLVTAEKEQALTVLADKVPAEIRDLTVSVLGADEDGRKRLGDSIRTIQTRVGLVDRRVADERITELTEQIDRLDRRWAEVTGQLRHSRRSELETLPGTWRAGTDITPQTAAGWLADHPEWGVVPDPIAPGTACPLTPAEYGELVGLIRDLDPDDAREAVRALPSAADLPSAAQVAQLFAEREDLAVAAERARPLARGRPEDPRAPGDIVAAARSLAGDLRDEAEWRASIENTWLVRVIAQSADPRLAAEWTDLVAAIGSLRDQIFELRKRWRGHDVRLPADPPPDFEQHLTDAEARLRSSGKLGLFARDAKAAVEACQVDGRPPTTADQVRICLDFLATERLRHQLARRWRTQTAEVGAPGLAGLPEESVGTLMAELAEVPRTVQRWNGLLSRAADMGLPPLPADPAGLSQRATEADDLVAAARRREIDSTLAALGARLEAGRSVPAASALWSDLATALSAVDVEYWAAAVARAQELADLAPRVHRRAALLARLAAVAPSWASEIGRDADNAGPVDELDAVWEWRQLETWVGSIAARPSPAVLQSALDEITAERRRAVVDLVTEKAWRRLVDNLGAPQRQALEQYVQASKRFGKTGGKHASRWIAEMRRAMTDATTAVPVWIMPTSRALMNFRPTAEPPFDVLIIDEASQIGMTALPLLSLARSTIVVGDDQQTSPENVGLDRDPVFRLMDDHLRDIPGYRTVFDPDKSLYDLALMRFPGRIMLTEHFRCLPPIIEFSNQLSYNGQIVPLRDRPPHPGWQALRTITVPDGFRRGFENRPEAEAVVALLRDLDARPEYDGMTFGVISLLGTAQSALIKGLLYDQLGPAVIDRRQIRVGEAAGFQGDERDVVVISTVVAVDPTKDKTRYSAMTREADKRRLNVAASRARNQLWVVTSVEPGELPAGDYRAALLVHCATRAGDDEERGDLLERCESEFERRVVRKLVARGYADVAVQHRVGQYRLDIVVSGPDARLAIECDGDRWHSEREWDRDRARQQVLERAGWTFERIRGSAFYRDPDLAMEPVWERLEALGIPVGEWRSAPVSDVPAASDIPAASGATDAGGSVEPEPSVAVPPGDGVQQATGHPEGGGRGIGNRSEDATGPIGADLDIDDSPSWVPPSWYRPPVDDEGESAPVPRGDGAGNTPSATPRPDGPPDWYRQMLAERSDEG